MRVFMALVVLLVAACASPGPVIRIHDAWSRPVAESTPGVAYFSIVNKGDEADRLIGVRSPCCTAVEIHETRIKDDVMRMVPVVDGVVVEPGSTVALEPGGYHVMLLGLDEPLRAGASFQITLDFERSGSIPVEVEIRRQ